eukprot:364253-Chlamydomonas_euryale.AAC.21
MPPVLPIKSRAATRMAQSSSSCAERIVAVVMLPRFASYESDSQVANRVLSAMCQTVGQWCQRKPGLLLGSDKRWGA